MLVEAQLTARPHHGRISRNVSATRRNSTLRSWVQVASVSEADRPWMVELLHPHSYGPPPDVRHTWRCEIIGGWEYEWAALGGPAAHEKSPEG